MTPIFCVVVRETRPEHLDKTRCVFEDERFDISRVGIIRRWVATRFPVVRLSMRDRRLIYILSRQWRIWIISWYSAAGTPEAARPLQSAGAWQRYVRVFDERTRYVADFFVSSFWHRHQRRAMSSGSPLSRIPAAVSYNFIPSQPVPAHPIPFDTSSSYRFKYVTNRS